MAKCILHGGRARFDNELNRSFYAEIARDVPNDGVILLCYFASGDSDTKVKFQEDIGRFTSLHPNKNLKFVFAEETNFIQQLKQSHALYIRGGSTPRLLKKLSAYPDLL